MHGVTVTKQYTQTNLPRGINNAERDVKARGMPLCGYHTASIGVTLINMDG
jgi:hypothetical protein